MKKARQILSILLSVAMLISLMPTVFAGSALPTVFKWSETTAGIIEFEPVADVTEYAVEITKTGSDKAITLYAGNCAEANAVIDARHYLLEQGSGEYTACFISEENGAISEKSNAVTYQYNCADSLPALPLPTDFSYSNGEFKWSADNADVAEWEVTLYAISGYNVEPITILTCEGSENSLEVDDKDLFAEFDRYIKDNEKKSYAYLLYATVRALPKDITANTFSAESDRVVIPRVAETNSGLPTEFKWSDTTPGIVEFKAIPGVEKYYYRFEHLKTNNGYSMGVSLNEGIVKADADGNATLDLRWNMGDNCNVQYTFNFVITDTGSYNGEVIEYSMPLVYDYVPGPNQQPLAKPTGLKYEKGYLSWDDIDSEVSAYHLSFYAVCGEEVNNLGGVLYRPSKKLTGVENNDDWWFDNFDRFFEREENKGLDKSKYSLYAALSVSPGDIVNYLESHESDMVLIPRSSGAPVVPPPSVVKYKVTYKVLNNVYGEFEVESGKKIPAPSEVPTVEGYIFEEWEGIPSDGIMPAKDIVITAKLKPLTTIKGKVTYNGAPVKDATITVPDSTANVVTDENGEFSVANYPCGSFVINVEYNGMKTAVNVDATTSETDLGEIVVKELGTGADIKTPNVQSVIIADAEALLSDEDKTFLETAGNTIVIEAKADTAASNAGIESEASAKYSKYTHGGVFFDLTIAKIKNGDSANPIAITEANELIAFEIEIPQAIRGKSEYIILREHNGAIDVISKKANADGEYLTVSGNVLTLYAKKFSVYSMYAKNVVRANNGSSAAVSYFTIKFDYDNGTSVQSVKYNKNEKIEKPADPTKEGFVFGGWYTDKACTKEYDFETKVTKNLTLYAKWTESTTIVLTIDEVTATIDGETVTNDVAPIIVNDRTMLPIRFIAEALGASVEWDEDARKVTVKLGENVVEIVIDEAVAIVNGEEFTLDSPAFIQNDRTYLPVRFVMEALDADVQWDGDARTVTIVK